MSATKTVIELDIIIKARQKVQKEVKLTVKALRLTQIAWNLIKLIEIINLGTGAKESSPIIAGVEKITGTGRKAARIN